MVWVGVFEVRQMWCGWVRAGTGFLMRRGYAKIVTLCPPSPTHARAMGCAASTSKACPHGQSGQLFPPTRTAVVAGNDKAHEQSWCSGPAKLTTTTSVWKGPAAGDDFGVPPPHEEPAAAPFQTRPDSDSSPTETALPSHPMHTSALVLFSGGQDSTTCLAHALSRYERVETLAFDYGQRHQS